MVALTTRRDHTHIDLTQELEWRIQRTAERAHPIFVANDWKYGFNNPEVPSPERLAVTIRSLVRAVMKVPGPGVSSCSGRFFVVRDNQGEIEIGLELDGPV